ncbi:hypothetical protein PV392_00510 [Streptomyces sp. ME03-5709C]|nr:hypothetical protein [Streptomyces sp. ME03-5709C]
MTRGAEEPPPRANVDLARGCGTCFGWGTVVTDQGRHELCPDCQDGGLEEVRRVRAVRLRPGSRYSAR